MVQNHTNLPFAGVATLKVYLYYRLILSGLLAGLFALGAQAEISSPNAASLFGPTAYAYFASSILGFYLLLIPRAKLTELKIQIFLCSDIAAQLILIHASGGAESGLGYLLIITAAMLSFFVRGRIAYGYAAFMTLAVLLDAAYFTLYDYNPGNNKNTIFSSGILGALIFAATIAIHTLTEKIRQSQAEAIEQNLRIKNLQELAQLIVTRMQTGIIVVDANLDIELINDSAKQMLGLDTKRDYYQTHLYHLSTSHALMNSWDAILNKRHNKTVALKPGTEIRVSVSKMQGQETKRIVIYLEDYIAIKQQAQQLKLASMGKLSARIAHEIRNPLGAIFHASQLLSESDDLPQADKRMTEIIEENSKRINSIVDSTMAMSRRKEPMAEEISLDIWLLTFVKEYNEEHACNIKLKLKAEELYIKFDLTQLRQVLVNLIENALRHGLDENGDPNVEIEAGMLANDRRAYLAVKNTGTEIPKDKIDEIFEPFFTTHHKGSGLGLYICKELVEINHASLNHERLSDQTIFKIEFSHHLRIR